MPTEEEIAAAAAQLEADAAAAEAAAAGTGTGAAAPTAEEAAAAQAAEDARIQAEVERRIAAEGLVKPAATTQVAPNDPNADLVAREAELEQLRATFQWKEADRLAIEIAEERAVRRVRQEMTPMMAGGLIDQTVNVVAKDLPAEGAAYIRDQIKGLNPAQLMQLQNDKQFAGILREAAENVARKGQDAATMRTMAVAGRNTAPTLSEDQKSAAEGFKKQYGHLGLSDTELDELAKDIVNSN